MKTIYIGKSTDNDIVIADSFVSRKHLRITMQSNGEYLLEDLGSTNGTFVNGNRVQSKLLSPNDIVKIGDTVLPWQNYFKPAASISSPSETPLKTISIGRNPQNDFVINNPNVSQKHAILQVFSDSRLFLIDVGSTNGTFIEGKKIDKLWVSAGLQVQFGNEKIFISQILDKVQVFPNTEKTPSVEEVSSASGNLSPVPAKNKQEKERLPKKRIPFEGIAALLLLALAIYGGIVFLQKNDKNKTESALKKEEKPNQQDEKDYLKNYDDEGRLIENKELEKNENKQNDNQENSTRPNSGNLEDIVESAENAIFRVDAFSNGISQGFGTGFFVSKLGVGVSNYHVFSPGTNWQIKLKNGETYEVTKVLKEDADLDYVIFETSAQNVAFLPLAPQIPRKGQDVFVIGNPQGFEFSVTKGIVSGIRNYNRNIGTASEGDDYIQIDAPISSGNSGGPVLNMNGEVVGIATMVVNGKSGVAQNLNLAVNIQKLNMQ